MSDANMVIAAIIISIGAAFLLLTWLDDWRE